jgi:transposase
LWLYSQIGGPSIPPERLLKAQLPIALYSVRSDRLSGETLDYNILFRWRSTPLNIKAVPSKAERRR